MTRTLDVAEFERILAGERTDLLKEFFSGTSDADRAPLAKTALAAYRRLQKKEETRNSVQHRTAFNAVLVTGSAEDLNALTFDFRASEWFDYFLLNELKPQALRQLGDVMLKQNVNHYRSVRVLVDKELCDIPSCDEVVLGLVSHWGSGNSIADRYREEPIVRANIWRLFEVEGGGENSLAAHDKYAAPERTWSYGLVKLSETGELPRARLLDESLQALDRGFDQFRAGWFSRFHEQLKPTLEERSERADLYGRLLASRIGPTVSFALAALKEVDGVHPLSTEFLQTYLPPALSAKAKATASGALALLAKAVKREPKFTRDAAHMALAALMNESPDVQQKALKLVQDDPSAIAQLANYADLLAPSVRAHVGVPATTVETPSERYVQRTEAEQLPVLEKLQRVEPIASVRELVDAIAQCLEVSDPMQIERVLDGASRLVAPNRKEFETAFAPVLKRARKLDGNAGAMPVAWYFSNFCVNLAQGLPTVSCEARGPLGAVLRDRFNSVLWVASKGHSVSAFAAPTHDAFWIAPEEFERRDTERKERGIDVPMYEREVALCRVPPWAVQHPAPEVAFDKFNIHFGGMSPDVLLLQAGMYPRLRGEFLAANIRTLRMILDYVDVPSRLIASVYFLMLSDWSQPTTNASWELLAIALFAADAELASYGTDALVMLIERGLLDVQLLGGQLQKYLFANTASQRLVKATTDVARISGKHRNAVRRLFELALRGGENEPKNLAAVLEFYHELLVAEEAHVEEEQTKKYLRSIKTQGKAKKLATAILSRG